VDALIAMLTDRPYVVAFLVAFLVIAWAERGGRRTLFWLASGTVLGWLAEFSSVRTGFPFGFYSYHPAKFPRELWLGEIPVFASLSFAFLSYFGYSAACAFLSPLERRGFDIRRVADPGVDESFRVLLLAALITTWADTVTDPVAHLGRFWFLGDLYAYRESGFHFHVPLSNYAGWLFTSSCIVFVNQRFDAWLRRRETAPQLRGFRLPFEPLWAVGSLLGNFVFMLAVTAHLIISGSVPPAVPLRAILASGIALSALFVVFAAVMIRRGLARSVRVPTVPKTRQRM
jgi:putative membrane protein